MKTQHFIMGLQGEVEEIDYKKIYIHILFPFGFKNQKYVIILYCENLRSIGTVDQENTGYGDTFNSFLYIKII